MPASPHRPAPDPLAADPAAASRTLRLARHLFGVEAAAWVPLDERQPVACDGPLFEAGGRQPVAGALRAVATRVVTARAGAIVGDTGALPVLSALSGRFRFLAAAPIQPGGPHPAALVLLDGQPRAPRPQDRAALADLVLLLDSAPEPEGRVLLEHVPSPVGTLLVTEAGLVFGEGNAAAARYFCPAREALPGCTPREAGLSLEAAARWTDAARACLAAAEPVRFLTEHPGPEGPRSLQVTVRPAGTAAEPRVSYVAEDVTAQAAAEASLRRAHAEFERIFTGSPDAILFAGPDRVLRRANPAACRLFGYAEGEIAGRPTAALYADDPDHARQGEERFREDAQEQLDPVRLRWRRRDGSTFLGELVGAPVRDEDGALLGFIGIIRDVSEQVRAAEALRESEALLRALVDNAPVILYALDADGRLSLSEGKALAALGLNPAAVVGRSVFEVYAAYPTVTEGVRCALGGETVSFTAPVRGRAFENRVAPMVDAEGRVTGAIGVGVDVTERDRAEAALRAAHAEAEGARAEADRARAEAEAARAEAEAARAEAEQARRQAEEAARATGAFLAAMSHEIRTPLTGVVGFADLLVEEAEGEARAYAELIQRGGRRLMSTLNSVLDLARIDAEQMEVCRARVDLAAEVAEAAQLLRPLAQKKGLELDVTTAPATAATDPSVLHRVLANLIGNAIKFTETGRVSVTVGAEGGRAVIRVEDTGPGITPDFLPHLFEPFRREADGAGRPSGTGLGLAITKRLVDLLGGEIEVASEQGWGSTFTLRLPLAEDGPAPAWRPMEELTGADG